MQLYRPHRFPAGASVEVQSRARRRSARILDINQNGARLVGTNAYARGDQITVFYGLTRLEAVVRWVSTDRCGVSFASVLPSNVLKALKSKGSPGRMSLYG